MQTKTLLLLANGFEIFEAGVFIDVLGWNRVEGDQTTELVICGFQREIKGTFGVTLIADVLIDEIDIVDYDALAIPGGFETFKFYDQSYSEQFTSIIRQFNDLKKPIASICTGALPIGKSGALKAHDREMERQQHVYESLRNSGFTDRAEACRMDGSKC